SEDASHGVRHQDLPTRRLRHNAGGRVHSFPEQIAILPDDLTGVQAGTHPDVVLGGVRAVVFIQKPLDTDSAVDGGAGGSERGHETVAHSLYLMAPVLVELTAHELPVCLQTSVRSLVAAARPQGGRPFDVGD